MLSYENSKFIICMMLLAITACSRKPIQSSGTLPKSSYAQAGPGTIEQHRMPDSLISPPTELKTWNQKAGHPTFGLIAAFYQLPESMPAGAVSIQSGRIFGASYDSFRIESGVKPYALLPASVEQAQIFSRSMNEMLDMGVNFVEVSMADANQIMRAEKEMLERKSFLFPGRSIPSGVDLLVSIQSGEGSYGPSIVGRVIQSKTGRLLALAAQPYAGPVSLEPLLTQLVSDSLRRLAHEQPLR